MLNHQWFLSIANDIYQKCGSGSVPGSGSGGRGGSSLEADQEAEVEAVIRHQVEAEAEAIAMEEKIFFQTTYFLIYDEA